ncbi:hypothetical protein LSM04_007180 [Trypanosoma melophagium]|uniref:uncharacterized protein n=1 Tax=Trypanosoma melophagium TaxID=715481 RepID=UPI003519FC4C|nr:hypothetical protein LSM04_007180 [Trypanosoma melophagium]
MTGFRQYITDKAHNTVCYGYMLEILGGVYSIFFNHDEKRTVLPYSFDNKLNEKHNDENATVKSIVPEWIHRVERLIGACIETTTWHKSSSSCCDHNDEHNFGMENTTICWELLWENAARQLCDFQCHLKGTDVSGQLWATLHTSASNPGGVGDTTTISANHVGELDDPYCFDGRSTNIADEVMMLLAEEEMVVRMKLEKYTTTTQKVKGV